VYTGTHLFVKVPQLRDSEVTFSVFESSCHLLLSVKPLKDRGNPVKCLAQGHNKQTCRPISTLSLLMLNVNQGSCEYQLLKSFGLTHFLLRTIFWKLWCVCTDKGKGVVGAVWTFVNKEGRVQFWRFCAEIFYVRLRSGN